MDFLLHCVYYPVLSKEPPPPSSPPNPWSPAAAVKTLLLAHGPNYLSVCLWLPLRAAVSRAQVLCGPELLTDTPPTPTSLCLCPLTQQPSLSLSRSSSRTVTDSALFCRRSHAPPLPHRHPSVSRASFAFFSVLSGPRRHSFKIFILTGYQRGCNVETR